MTRIYARKDAKILEAAEELFLRDGYAATSMTAVAGRAGVAKQTLYSNFPSKEELFSSVVGRRSVRAMEPAAELDVDHGGLESTLTELGVAFLSHIYSTEQVELFRTGVAESRQFPELGAKMIDGPFLETPSTIEAFLRARVERGELDLPDVEFGTAMFTSLLKADVHRRLLFNQPADTSPATIRRIATQAVHLFLRGAATR